ncbi:uncharacterized protein LOC129581229 [Paramacrobiotus metropolitanus]|uniref:uncharacterized protein LOC129581229 n=1 Tax=Paramacrobiotus metropolitanus TaxID=2943436 RepID=UPI0024458CA6|nr:uncharacterized protein LOC129581229 [Paramacrobiotus metropolitanus]XP_055328167.1 uncharacterized protein LOC129581229 [Paramacrobiotus metropolitanus]XP_055328168.1 uncharacterized protein LOC129581229 [Paramacrobiotus metropolitanus]
MVVTGCTPFDHVIPGRPPPNNLPVLLRKDNVTSSEDYGRKVAATNLHMFRVGIDPALRFYTFAGTWIVAMIFQQKVFRNKLPRPMTHRYFLVLPIVSGLIAQQIMHYKYTNSYRRLWLESQGVTLPPKNVSSLSDRGNDATV